MKKHQAPSKFSRTQTGGRVSTEACLTQGLTMNAYGKGAIQAGEGSERAVFLAANSPAVR